MRFVCDSCRAQYMISDDKVGPKGVKLRCKKCGHTILVRPAGASAAKEGGAEAAASPEAKSGGADANAPRIVESSGTGLPATLGTPPEGGLFTDVEEDEIGAVFDQVLSTGSQKIKAAEAEAEAKAAKAEAVRKLAEAESAEPSPEDAKAASSHEWYVAIDEKQVGPWSVEKVKDAWDRGEVGPDNLCWRSGFSDWIPLSETAELASVLAPRPAKPVIVAPAPVSTSSPVIPAGPVESAFSAGSSRPGLGGSSAVAEEPVGWKPSAASVLASLVKEENDALTKPPPRPAPSLEREPVSQARLLDVPMPPPEPVSSPAMAGAMMGGSPGMAAPSAYAPQPPQGYAPQPVQPYAQPQPVAYPPQQAQMPYGQQPQGYPPQGYPAAYPPPAAAPTGGKGRTVMLIAVTAGVLVMAGAAVVVVARGNSSERPVEPPAQVATAPTPKVELPPMPPPPAAVQPPPAAVQPTAQATPPAPAPGEGAPATAAVTPAAATAGTVPVAAATPPATAPAVAVAPAATPPPPVAAVQPAVAPNMGTAVARVDSRNHRKTGSGSSRGSQRDEDDGDAITVSKPSSSSSSSSASNSGGGDDDFDELFGTKKAASSAKPAGKPTATAYIPPEPGGGTPERLQQSDIMQVVLNNKPAIVKCVNEQKQKDPSLSGKLVMRWTVQTSGKTTGVSCRTDEFRTSYMATCITGLIKGWAFPKHQKQGDPIDFPFTF
ncbi:adventurous gliding motility protein GltJ [Corallococcus sp. Z5C101001]|uniref:adventurous gliding motility protein GltJ n=1 Tax=Corallococcus sp. Z5C101001 TaxID=2596829 RepID=UPI00117D095F|nr:adventurous gliding motility protein GltJ [Corallococcus sp. Z5C101001]TSC23292.1 adventurous gliding motility protein GltJ [Corallococcus sp. Z5C101001]